MYEPSTSEENPDYSSEPIPTMDVTDDDPSDRPSLEDISLKLSEDDQSQGHLSPELPQNEEEPEEQVADGPSRDDLSPKLPQDEPHEDEIEDDTSLLHPPLKTALKNVKQIIGALKDGTHEVKDILVNECNIIYECKLCRNFFRCLANLVTHKRFYCKERNGPSLDSAADIPKVDEITIIEPVGVSDDEEMMSDGENEEIEPENNEPEPVAEVSFSTPKIFDSSKMSSPNKFAGVTRNKPFSPQKQMISLLPVKSRPEVKFQIIKKKENIFVVKNVKTEPTKPCAVQLKKIETEFKLPNKRVVKPAVNKANALSNRTDCDVKKLTCLKCNIKFSMYRGLYSHMNIVHATKRLHFPCPLCTNTFLKIQSVKRHMMINHKKTSQQVERLKDAIRRKAYYKKVQGPSTSSTSQTQPAEQSKPVKKTPKVHWHRCQICQRAFDRKTSLISHEKACRLKSKEANSDKKPSKPSPSPGTKRCGQCRRTYSVFQAECVCKKTSYTTSFKRPPPSRAVPVNVGTASSSVPTSRPKRITNKRENKDFVDSQSLKWRSANCVESVTASKEKAPPTERVKAPPTERVENVGLPPAIEKRLLVFMNSKRNSCLKCCKKFSSISNLRRHVATHVGWTRFQCKICSYRSFDRAELRGHVEKTHTSVPPNKIDNVVDQVHRLSSVPPTGVNSPMVHAEPVIRPTKPKQSPPGSGKSLTHMINNLTSRVLSSSPSLIKREMMDQSVLEEGAAENEVVTPHIEEQEEELVKNECMSDLEYHLLKQNARIATTTKPIITTLIRKDFLTQDNNNEGEGQILSGRRTSGDSHILNSILKVKEENAAESGNFTTLVTRSGTYQKKISHHIDLS